MSLRITPFRRLSCDRRGIAAAEFALWMVLFFITMLAALDIGSFSVERARLAQAMSGASIAAFKSRDTVNFTALPAYLRSAAGVTTPGALTVTIGCNGGQDNCVNTSRTCSCLTSTATLVAAGSCGAPCGSGASANSQSGYYMKMTASYPFRPALLPRGMLGNGVVSQSTTVRLQ
ncbi:TadE/TadG family type IV pilus assembly protein [Sphingomonas phyllosphaerae]|uniref:TadE/TadG family type IV pilus assembly protein n=1 Tax=Sphingomonas phyllosphaerae TaxID=257003 RepID=UPI000417D07E|nr:hypothetical protein [Sphingomonas phyllosphaerae]